MATNDLDWQHRQELIDRLYEIDREIGQLGAERKHVQLQLSALNVREARGSNDIFARLFKRMAFRLLSKEDYTKVVTAVQEKLNWADRRVEGEDNGE